MSSKSSKAESSKVGQPAGIQYSEVWTYFSRIEDGFDVICRQEQCRKVVPRKDSKQTCDMWKHLQQAHEDLYKKTAHSQRPGQQKKLDLEKIRMTTRSAKTDEKAGSVEDTGAARTRPLGEKNNTDEASSKPEGNKIESPRKTRKRAAAPSEPDDGESSNTTGPSNDALKSTTEPSEPKKKQTKADVPSEPKKNKQPKAGDSSEPKQKQVTFDGSSEPRTTRTKAGMSSEPKQKKQPKADVSSEPKQKNQPKAGEKSYESRLIAAVQRQPGLYDRKHPDYAPQGTINVALWTAVANEIGVTDHQAHDDWARLRERYAKQLHRRDVERKEISWPHYDAMSFLEPFMQTKKKKEETTESADTGYVQPQDEDAEDEEENEGEEEDDDAPTFEDLVVAQVQRFPYLYDTTLEDYANKRKKSEAWSLAAKTLKKTTLDVRTRWHQIRSKFSKKVKRAVAEGDDLERLKEDKLAFLIPFTKHAADGKTDTNDDGHALLEEMPEVTVEIPKFEEDPEDHENDDEVDQDSDHSDDDSVAGSEDDDSGEDDASEADENEGHVDATNGAEVAVKQQGQQSAAPPSSVDSPRKPGPSKLREDEEESDDDDEDELFLRQLRCKFRKMDEATKERTKAKLWQTVVDVNYGPK